MIGTTSEQLSFPRRPLILGIAGCSGSGKTTLARELTAQLNATLLPLDFYYRDLSHLAAQERALQNFDHPNSIESELLGRHVVALAEGEAIERPVYDFSQHIRVAGQTETVMSAEVLIIEGILALHYENLRALYDFSIYVNAPHELCLKRRIYRDVRERGGLVVACHPYWCGHTLRDLAPLEGFFAVVSSCFDSS